MARFVFNSIISSVFFSLLVIAELLCEPVAVTRGEHDIFENPSCSETGSECTNCVAMNARCVSSHNTTSTCDKCACIGQYKTYVSHFRDPRCVRDDMLLFYPDENNSFMVQQTTGEMMCITYNQLKQNSSIRAAKCNSTDTFQKWIWTRHDQLRHVRTSKCIQQGELQNPDKTESLKWYLGLEECNMSETKQKWYCEVNLIKKDFIDQNGQRHLVYMTFSNNILKLEPTPTYWQRRRAKQNVCSLPSGCNVFSNPYSAMLVLRSNCSQKGERQIGNLPEGTGCCNMLDQLQYLDANGSWEKLHSTNTIFQLHNSTSVISLMWDLTAAPSNWSNMIIKLNFHCGKETGTRCVLIKLKAALSADCSTNTSSTTSTSEILTNPTTTPRTTTHFISTPASTLRTSDTKIPTRSGQESTTASRTTTSTLTKSISTSPRNSKGPQSDDPESSSVVGIVVGLLVAVAALSAVILGIVLFRKRRSRVDKTLSDLEINNKGQTSGDTLNPLYSSEVTSNPSFSNDGGIYQEPDRKIDEASKACELYEPSDDHEHDYAKVEEKNKPVAPVGNLEYDYAKSDEVKSAVNRLPVKYNHYHNSDINNQNVSTKTSDKEETKEKENDAGPLYQTLEDDTRPVYQTLEEE